MLLSTPIIWRRHSTAGAGVETCTRAQSPSRRDLFRPPCSQTSISLASSVAQESGEGGTGMTDAVRCHFYGFGSVGRDLELIYDASIVSNSMQTYADDVELKGEGE